MDAIVVTTIGGICPTQAEGTLHDYPFYFRARHGEWKITVAPKGEDPVRHDAPFYYAEGDDETEGAMPHCDVMRIIGLAYTNVLQKHYSEQKNS